ncbi:glutamate decarboxylase-like isoform X2 [Symsagittifera roscoffensis]
MEQVESSNNTNNSSSPKEQMSHPKSALATAPSGQQKGEFKKVKSKEVFFGDEVSHPIEKAQLETERGRENSITELHQESGLKSPAGKFDPTVKPHEDLKRQMSESLLQKRKSISEEQLKMKKGMAKSNLDFAKLTAKDILPHESFPHSNTGEFLRCVVDELIDFMGQTHDRAQPVLEFHHPAQLRGNLDLDVPETPEHLAQLLSDIKDTCRYAVKSGHPRFFNQLSCGMDVTSIAGEWLTATINTNMFTYEVSPVFVIMERMVLKRLRELVGWADGAGDGICAPGGTISNLYALMLARHKYFPQLKHTGLKPEKQLCMFVSKESHYSYKNAAMITGIGINNCIPIETDARCNMDPKDLEAKIQKVKKEGKHPLFLGLTMGTTVVGAVDQIRQLAPIANKHDLWIHVDAAWGGGVLMSNKWKHILDGIHLADSVTWNPHKLLGVTLQCSALLVKEDGILESCNALHADYLFQQDKHYDVSYDTGDKAIQCGRHVDIFKFWLMWRAKGRVGMEAHVNLMFDLRDYLVQLIHEKQGFQMVFEEPQFLNVCFWYIPECIRGMPEGQARTKKLHKVAPIIKGRMMNKGDLMVGYQPLFSIPNFFRMVISNQASRREDILYVVEEIDRLGHDIEL